VDVVAGSLAGVPERIVPVTHAPSLTPAFSRRFMKYN
jgi:hypothetical protein